MRRFKPLLPFGDGTVVEHTIRYFRDAGVNTIVVVVGYRAEEVQQALKGQEVIYAFNEEPESEMIESIKLGVRALPESAEAMLLTPVDHAAVPPEVVRTLIQHWREGARLIIPTWQERGGHPVLIDTAFRDELSSLEADGLRSFFAAHHKETVRLPVSSQYVVRDMDTWDDYRELHEEFFAFPPKEFLNEA